MKKGSKIKIVILFFVLLMLVLIYVKYTRDTNLETIENNKINLLFEKVNQTSYAKVNKYIVYGTHFNIEGTLDYPKVSGISVYSADIILQSTDNIIQLDTTFSHKDNMLSFTTISEINNGLNLEKLVSDKYYIFLKLTLSNSEIKYYSLQNNSHSEDITYFSLAKNKIDINFDKYNSVDFMAITQLKVDSLPDDVYDIAIDASHGGNDSGAKKGKITEAEIVLNCAKNLKQKLEVLGYKVFLTRDGTESDSVDMTTNMYDENGRINLVQASHAKLLFSLNINDVKSKKGGVEVYAPSNCNLSFAKLLSDNIVKSAKTSYSSSNLFKKDNGVYVRNFTKTDIDLYTAKAKKSGYDPYNITTSTPFLYMIRETGGIATNAFVDGRNKHYGKNKYFDSNVGIETYSIELGYMFVPDDLDNITKNYDLYMQGISNSISEFYK